MPVHVVLEHSFRVNGKKHGDREEVPHEQRETVEKAIEAVKVLAPGVPGTRVPLRPWRSGRAPEPPRGSEAIVER